MSEETKDLTGGAEYSLGPKLFQLFLTLELVLETRCGHFLDYEERRKVALEMTHYLTNPNYLVEVAKDRQMPEQAVENLDMKAAREEPPIKDVAKKKKDEV